MPTYNPDDWQAWMRAAQGGDAGAYRRLLAALQPWLTAYFRRRLSGDARGGDSDDQGPDSHWIRPSKGLNGRARPRAAMKGQATHDDGLASPS